MKTYFCEDINEEMSYPKSRIIEQMKEQGLKSVIVYEAQKYTGKEVFFCRHFEEAGMIGDRHEKCGKSCLSYSPRNGKFGICKHYASCYTPEQKYTLDINGKLTKI